MLIAWARGGQLGRRGQGYQAILEFPVACGITVCSSGSMLRVFRPPCLVTAVLPVLLQACALQPWLTHLLCAAVCPCRWARPCASAASL